MKFIAAVFFGVILSWLTVTAFAQQSSQSNVAQYDITNYRMAVQLIPDEHLLRAGADITFTSPEPTRSVVFELNGSLHVDNVERDGQVINGFVQDAIGTGALGPNVRIDLGQVMPAKQPITVRIRWSGALESPAGGPLATKRLAYVGPEGSYLLYAARWFPFHDYAVDRATTDITIVVPTGLQVVGTSDEQLVPQQSVKDGTTRYRFVQRHPVLPGNFVAGFYVDKNFRFGNWEVQMYTKPGSEGHRNSYAELIGKTLEFYMQQYGTPNFGTQLIVAQTDDNTLDAYSGSGIIFLASKFFDDARGISEKMLQREVAYQWWGQTVGLKSFDDIWLSAGFAEWSAFNYRESNPEGKSLDSIQQEEQEQALVFEQTASIVRMPAVLDDQTAAFRSVMFYKGAMVLSMLRETIGKETFQRLLRHFLENYRGENASLEDFERLTSQEVGENMRFFFAQWLEGTGVPEFDVDYQILRTKAGKFRVRGTVKQDLETLRMPIELMLHVEGGDDQTVVIQMNGKSQDFNFDSTGPPIEVAVDPGGKILRMSEHLKTLITIRRGIEQMHEGNWAEARQQFEAVLKVDHSNSWAYYNLGLAYLEEKNWLKALDSFGAALEGSLRPSWIEVWAHIKRGNAYDAEGDRPKAVYEYNKALQTNNNYDNALVIAKKFIEIPFDPKKIDK